MGLGHSRKAVHPRAVWPVPNMGVGTRIFCPRHRSGSRQACHQSFSRQVDRTSPWGIRTAQAMKPTAWAASLLVSLLLTLMPMAWASPVDPGWTKGIYDDGDHGDVINYLTSNAFGIPVLPVHGCDQLLCVRDPRCSSGSGTHRVSCVVAPSAPRPASRLALLRRPREERRTPFGRVRKQRRRSPPYGRQWLVGRGHPELKECSVQDRLVSRRAHSYQVG